MVISKETRLVITALHKNGLTRKSIAARKIAPQSTICHIIKNFKRGSIVAKKAPGRPRKTSKHQNHLLKVFKLRDRATSSAELAQKWQQAGVNASARTVRRRLLEQGLVSRRAAKKPLLSRKNIRDRLIFCQKCREWTAEDWGKVIFSDESPFRLFGKSGKRLVRRRRGEGYHQSCLVPTKPETIHVWSCFSAKGVGSLTVWPKNTAMNKEWNQNVLREQLLRLVVINGQNAALIVQEWITISQDLVQKLIESMAGRTAEVLKKRGQHCN
uniref:Transposase Tc1-like domain-containing protein n=1 Tax=Poecilia formosa TaxID=48698 RepID=A0A096LWT8_POEFO